MKRMTILMMALVVIVGFTQCKKEQPATPQSESNIVRITLNVNGNSNNGSRVDVVGSSVTFGTGDVIHVASGGAVVGTLVHNGSSFSGEITNPTIGEPLYFYFLGNKVNSIENGTTSCTFNISDQTVEMPVISMGVSNETYPSNGNSYSSKLYNKCALMKFNVTTPSDAAICITGMNNTVTIDFGKKDETGTGLGPDDSNNGFSYSMDTEDGGLIMMAGGNSAEKWAIVLPQGALSEGESGSAYSGNYYGVRPALDAIEANHYLSSGVSMTVNIAAANITINANTLGNWTNSGGDAWDGPAPGSGTFNGGWTDDGNDPWGN